MHADYFLVIGVVMGVFALPSFLNAFTEARFPRVAIALTALSVSCVAFANALTPQGYVMADLPRVFVRVLGPLIN